MVSGVYILTVQVKKVCSEMPITELGGWFDSTGTYR